MKKYLPRTYAHAVLALVSQGYAPEDVTNVLVSHLRKAKRLKYLDVIAHEVDERSKLGDGEIVDVSTAHPLSATAQKSVAKLAEKIYHTSVVLRTHEDSRVVGGIVLRNDDEVIDYSASTLVSNLHTHIKQDNQ